MGRQCYARYGRGRLPQHPKGCVSKHTMVRAICERMGLKQIADDKELREFSQATSVETLTQRLEDTLPNP